MLAQPFHEGLTGKGAFLGGGFAGYNLYAAREGWVAVAALEPHFAQRPRPQRFALEELSVDALRDLFASHDAAYWAAWGREHDLPIAAVRMPSSKESS